jgi:tetratricopeptide (TPR) repeat protein
MRNRSWSVLGIAGAALWLSGCGETAPEVKPQAFDVLVAEPRGQLLTGTTVKIHGFVVGGEASQVTAGKAVAKLGPGGRWEAEVPAGTDGAHTLEVSARAAKGGKKAKVEVAWTTDNTAPVVTITSPDGAGAVRGDAVRVEGSVTDISPVTVTAEGRPVQLDGTRFEFTKMLTEGENTAVVKATDAAGHTTEHTVTIRRDTAPPTVQLTTPPATVATATYRVQGEVSEEGCRVFVNGEEGVVTGRAFSFDLPLEPGPNPFIVVVRDAGGLESTAEGSVVLERRKPLTEEELTAVFRRHAGSGAGWYDGQFDALRVYGPALHPTLIALAQKLCLGEGSGDLALQACQALGELGVTDAIPMLAKVADTSQNRGLVDSVIFILARLGDTARADKIIEGYRRMIETNPGNGPTLWVQIGNGYARMNKYAKAEQSYRKAIAQASELGQPAPGVAWYNLGCQLAKLGKKDEAMAAIHERMKLPQPDTDWMATDGDLGILRDHPEFLNYLTADGTEQQFLRRSASVGTTHPASGLLILQKGVEKYPKSVTLWIFLAAALADGGKVDKGAEALAKGHELAGGGLNWDNIKRAPQLQPLQKLPNWKQLSGGKPVPPKKPDDGEQKEDF